MSTSSGAGTPQSPESQPEYVRDELDQDQITHQGEIRKIPPGGWPRNGGKYLGAVEDEQTPILPPMSGPADLVGEEDVDGQGNESGHTKTGDELFDPRDELAPG